MTLLCIAKYFKIKSRTQMPVTDLGGRDGGAPSVLVMTSSSRQRRAPQVSLQPSERASALAAGIQMTQSSVMGNFFQMRLEPFSLLQSTTFDNNS